MIAATPTAATCPNREPNWFGQSLRKPARNPARHSSSRNPASTKLTRVSISQK